MEAFDKLVKVMEKLRSKDGCPWDKKQTYESLLPYLLEEIYEYIDAVKEKDYENMKEELGDLLLQVVFHSQIAKEENKFTVEDVINEITDKLISRHPHVFGNRNDIKTSDDVMKEWEKFKEKEGKIRKSLLDGIPKSMPPLERAFKLQQRAAKVGFDWEKEEQVLNKVEEELKELKEALKSSDKNKIEEEVGDLLFAIVNLCRFKGVNPAVALHRTNEKFIKRFKYIEDKAKESGKELKNMSLEEMDKLWEKAKKEEREDVTI